MIDHFIIFSTWEIVNVVGEAIKYNSMNCV